MTVKAAGPDDELDEGRFTAYASVFDVVDSVGDVVVKGAFTDTLAAWAGSGGVVPLLWGHNTDDPDYNIGVITAATEDDHGLLVSGQLDLDAPKARQVYRLLKGRRVTQMSFAYDIDASEPVTVDGAKATALQKLRLHEISIVPLGANPHTEVLTVKTPHSTIRPASARVKIGRTLSAKNEDRLRGILDLLDQAADEIRDLVGNADTDSPNDASSPGTAGPTDHGTESSPGRSASDHDGDDRDDQDGEGPDEETGDEDDIRPRRRGESPKALPASAEGTAVVSPAAVRLLASLETLRLD